MGGNRKKRKTKRTITTGPDILQPSRLTFLPFHHGAEIFGAIAHDGSVVDGSGITGESA